MRYIRVQKIVNKMCDENVKDISSIKTIFKFIYDKQLFCSFILEIDYRLFCYEKVRILTIEEDECSFRAFRNKSTVKDTFKYVDVKELRLETEIEKVCNNENDKDTRWYLLDIEED